MGSIFAMHKSLNRLAYKYSAAIVCLSWILCSEAAFSFARFFREQWHKKSMIADGAVDVTFMIFIVSALMGIV